MSIFSHTVAWIKSARTCPPKVIDCTCKLGPMDSETAIFDMWSLSHIFCDGILISLPIFFVSFQTALIIHFVLSIAWEVIENTLGIWVTSNFCCAKCMYRGDNFWNSVGDVICNFLGFVIVYYTNAYYTNGS